MKSVSCAFDHDDVRVLDSGQALIVILLIIEDFPLERACSIEQQAGPFESATGLIPVDLVLVLVDRSQVAGERAVFLEVEQ